LRRPRFDPSFRRISRAVEEKPNPEPIGDRAAFMDPPYALLRNE
jgi:hypothetical protein